MNAGAASKAFQDVSQAWLETFLLQLSITKIHAHQHSNSAYSDGIQATWSKFQNDPVKHWRWNSASSVKKTEWPLWLVRFLGHTRQYTNCNRVFMTVGLLWKMAIKKSLPDAISNWWLSTTGIRNTLQRWIYFLENDLLLGLLIIIKRNWGVD